MTLKSQKVRYDVTKFVIGFNGFFGWSPHPMLWRSLALSQATAASGGRTRGRARRLEVSFALVM